MKLLIILLLLTSSTYADEWRRYAHDAEGVHYEYNHTRITHYDQPTRIFVVWTRRPHHSERWEVHCASASVRLTFSIERNESGAVIEQMTDMQATWQYAVPEGVEMALVDRICRDYEQ